MIWTRETNPWRRRFAFLPFTLSDGPTTDIVWWQSFWARDLGLYTEVSLTDPAKNGVDDDEAIGPSSRSKARAETNIPIPDTGGRG